MKNVIVKILIALLVIPLAIVFGPVLLFYFLCVFIYHQYLKLRLEAKWPQDKFILFTYSESENWSRYIEERIIPVIAKHAVIINRTKQQNWKNDYALERKVLDAFAGTGINPVALIFRKGFRVKPIALYEAFRDFQHGKEITINKKCEEIFSYVPSSP